MNTIYYNGTILTMAHSMQDQETYPEALLSDGHKILALGSLAELRAMCDTAEEIDLQGHTLMPGFIDGHSHLPMAAQFIAFADLSACRNFEDIRRTLCIYKEEHPQETAKAIIGYNYDHNFLEEGCHPNKQLLDQVSCEIPVFILHISSHMGVANSLLLDRQNITAQTPNPPGGRYGRMEDSQEPDGYLEEVSAFGPVMGYVYTLVQNNPLELMKQIQDRYLSYGVTTAQDGASSKDMCQLLRYASMMGILKMDIVSYIESRGNYQELLQQNPDLLGGYQNHWRIGGLKVVLDGSPQAKTAWLSKPYEGGDYCGYPAWKDEELARVTDYAIEHSYQLLAHCNGDAASDQFLTQYKASMKKYASKEDLRPVMIHCQTVREDQLDSMAEIAMIPSIFVGHVYYWGDIHKKNLGEKRGSYISPARDALAKGLPANFHQDAPVTAPDMMHSVWCAVNRVTREGQLLGPDQRISTYDALKCITIHPAYAYHEEASKGSLETGKLADLVILDQNPLSTDPMKLKDIKVLTTIIHN